MSSEMSGQPPRCDLTALSAYRDGLLRDEERPRIEAHLESCAGCRTILAQWAALGVRIAATPPAPPGMAEALASRLRQSGARSPTTASRWRLAAAAVAAVLIALALYGAFWPGQAVSVAAAYPVPASRDVPVEAAIEVQFRWPVDRPAVAEAVRIEPPVAVDPVWEGGKLVLQPREALLPDTQYTVTLGGQQITTFRTGPGQDDKQTEARPAAAVAAPSAVVPPGGTPTPPAAATVAAPACPETPARGFGKAYAEHGDLRAGLGCATEPERAVPMAEQSFQNGHMIWREDSRTIYVLFADGRWVTHPDRWEEGTPLAVTDAPPAGRFVPERGFGKVWREAPGVREGLSWAVDRERGFGGAAQSFERGVMLWSDRQRIYVLYADGTWQHFEDTYHD